MRYKFRRGTTDTPELRAELARCMAEDEFQPSSRGQIVITFEGAEYLALVTPQEIEIGRCEYVAGKVLDAGPFKGKQMMMPKFTDLDS